MSDRKLIVATAALGKPDSPVSILWGEDEGREPIPDIAKAMEKLGVQPETIKAFVDGTARATVKKRERAAVREVREGDILKAADKLRKACHTAGYGDDIFVGLVLGERTLVPFASGGEFNAGRDFNGALVTKAKAVSRRPFGWA
jgi:hypothetical protein